MSAIVNHTRYNELPSLEEANTILQGLSAMDSIHGPIRDIFIGHGVENTFCLYLQHRHHTPHTGETVVKVAGTAHLMDQQTVGEVVSFGNKVAPVTWMAMGGELIPMELAVVPAVAADPLSPPADFVLDFLSVLAKTGCDGLFGIDSMAERAWTEMKVGEASVLVPSSDIDSWDQSKFIPVAFAFDKSERGFRVHGRCGTDHKHSSKPK